MSDDLPGTTPRPLLPYSDLTASMYTPPQPAHVREIALALAWLTTQDPTQPAGADVWLRLADICGPRRTYGGRVYDLIATDAPRYERAGRDMGVCEGPRVRPYKRRRPRRGPNDCLYDHHPHVGDCQYTKIYVSAGYTPPEPTPRELGQVCGNSATIAVVERDMVTGWHTLHRFCRRHAARAEEVRAQIAARGTPPEPIPNRGGRLPLWFDADWAAVYRWACRNSLQGWRSGHPTHPARWQPPYYGLRRDQWPRPDQPIPKRPRLRVLTETQEPR